MGKKKERRIGACYEMQFEHDPHVEANITYHFDDLLPNDFLYHTSSL